MGSVGGGGGSGAEGGRGFSFFPMGNSIAKNSRLFSGVCVYGGGKGAGGGGNFKAERLLSDSIN